MSLIQNNKLGGIVHCDFEPNKNLACMNLSCDAIKLVDVPNAGGSSEVSEMFSFEVLTKVFKARLLKVGVRAIFLTLSHTVLTFNDTEKKKAF